MKRNYFVNNKVDFKNIRDIYEHTDEIKLTGWTKFKYNLGSIKIPFSAINLGLRLNSAKKKYKKYEKEGKPTSTATDRYKFINKILNNTFSYKRIKYNEFGFNYIPKTPVLYVANHKSNVDGLLILKSVIRHFELPFVRIVAKEELSKNKKYASALNLIDTLYVNRSDIRGLQQLIKDEVNVFNEDCSLLIFPEGTRVSGDQMGIFTSSALEVAFQTYVPIVPIVIFGTDGLLNSDKSNNKPRYNKSEIVIDALEPIKYSEYMHWSRPHLAEVLQQKIQERYDLWKENYDFMLSDKFKKQEKLSPLEANKRLNEQERERIKRKIDN